MPAMHLLDSMVRVHGVYVAKWKDPIPKLVPNTGSGCVAFLDFGWTRDFSPPKVTQKCYGMQSEAIQTLA